jgi:hypothetical protein
MRTSSSRRRSGTARTKGSPSNVLRAAARPVVERLEERWLMAGQSSASGADALTCDPDRLDTFHFHVSEGRRGDVLTVDLASPALSQFRFPLQQTSNDIGTVATFPGWDGQLQQGVFHLVPHLPPVFGPVRDTLTLSAESSGINCDDVSVGGPVNVVVHFPLLTDDYSTQAGLAPVTFDGSPLDTARIQHRLNYLGFPNHNGQSLTVDGAGGDGTSWAIGLFNAAVASSKHDPGAKKISAFINSDIAPRWREIPRSGTGWVNIDLPSDNHDWATSWGIEVINAAGLRNTGTPFKTNDASKQRGGDTLDHKSHESGMDLDIDVPSTDKPDTPFFAVTTLGGAAESFPYVLSKNGKLFLNDASRNYPEVDPDVYGSNIVFDGLRAHEAYDNEAILLAIKDRITDNTAAGYDLQDVRKQIQAFLGASTPSGAWVSQVFFNDPRTWDIPGVKFLKDHSGHFHVNVEPPPRPSADASISPGAAQQLQQFGSVVDWSAAVSNTSGGTSQPAPAPYGPTARATAADDNPVVLPLRQALPLLGKSLDELLGIPEILRRGVYDPLTGSVENPRYG